MKNKKASIAIAVLAFALALGIGKAFAQSATGSSEHTIPASSSGAEIITIATVNIYDSKIVSQDGNKIKIGFDLYNRTDVQPGIKYSVELIKTEGEGKDEVQTIVDEKIYDEKIYLGAGQTASREIEYVAPEYLSGDFSIWVTSKNDKGLGFGTSEAGKINLKGDGRYLEIIDNLCVLTVKGEENKAQYYPDQGVDISKDEILLANCKIKNNFPTSISAVPNFSLYYRDIYGEKISETRQSPISLAAGEEKIVTLEIPKAESPQAYDVVLSFSDEKGKIISSKANLHYVMQGQSATIQNLILDKDYYQKDDIAKLSILWDPSADAFFGARGKGTKDEAYSLDILIKNAFGETCSKKNKIELDSKKFGPQIFDIVITAECANPKITLSIKGKDGNVLDKSEYAIGNKSIQEISKKSGSETAKNIFYVFSVILVLIVISYAVARKKNRDNLTKILLFMIICGSFIFGFGQEARGDTFSLGWIGSTFDVNLNKENYQPGEQIKVTASVPYLRGCDNNVRHVILSVSISGVGSATLLDGRYMQESCATTFPGLFGNICKKKAKGEANFNAQSVPGSYSAEFSAYYELNGSSTTGSMVIPYNVKCQKPPIPNPSIPGSAWISQKDVETGGNFQVICDYGVASGNVFAKVGNNFCERIAWVWTNGVKFNCAAGNTAGTRNVSCMMKNQAPDYYCSGTDKIGTINVIGNNAPDAIVESPNADDFEFAAGEVYLRGKGTDLDGSIVRHVWFSADQCDVNPATGEVNSCSGVPKYSKNTNEAGSSIHEINDNTLVARAEPYVFYYRVKDNDNKWSAFYKRSFKIKDNKYTLTVEINNKDIGRVVGALGKISCGKDTTNDCTEDYNSSTAINLTATPEAKFKYWSGDIESYCSGNKCTSILMDQNRTITANFDCVPNSSDSQYCKDHAAENCRGSKFPEDKCGAYVCDGSRDCTGWTETGPE